MAGLPAPLCEAALLPAPRTQGVAMVLTYPKYPFLHCSLHHGSLQLLFSYQVPRDGSVDLRSSLLLNGPQSSLEIETR